MAMTYRHPTDFRNGRPVTVERDHRDPELEFYGWTVEGDLPADPAPVEPDVRKPRRRTPKPKPAEQDAGDGDDVEE